MNHKYLLGTIELSEMKEIIETLSEVEGISKVRDSEPSRSELALNQTFTKQETASHRAERIFRQISVYYPILRSSSFRPYLEAYKLYSSQICLLSALDINCDGELEEDEFIRGCLDDKDLINLINSGGIEPEEELD